MALRPSWRYVGERGPEAIVPLWRMGAGGPGGGGGITVNIGSIGGGRGLEDLTPDQIGDLVGNAVARQVREDGGVRSLIKRTARRGL